MNDELNEDVLAEIAGGLKSTDFAIEKGKESKFKVVRELAEKAEKKMPKKENEEKELSEEDLDKMAYDYYHNSEMKR